MRRTVLGLLRVLLILLGCGLFFVFAFTIVGLVGEALVVLAFVGWSRMRRGWRGARSPPSRTLPSACRRRTATQARDRILSLAAPISESTRSS